MAAAGTPPALQQLQQQQTLAEEEEESASEKQHPAAASGAGRSAASSVVSGKPQAGVPASIGGPVAGAAPRATGAAIAAAGLPPSMAKFAPIVPLLHFDEAWAAGGDTGAGAGAGGVVDAESVMAAAAERERLQQEGRERSALASDSDGWFNWFYFCLQAPHVPARAADAAGDGVVQAGHVGCREGPLHLQIQVRSLFFFSKFVRQLFTLELAFQCT
jgi:hypothetical protein